LAYLHQTNPGGWVHLTKIKGTELRLRHIQ
jgi:hypothetical protein